MQYTTEVFGMLFIPFAGMREYLACIKDLEQHYWYIYCSFLNFVLSHLIVYNCCCGAVCDAGCWTKYSNKLFSIWVFEILLAVAKVKILIGLDWSIACALLCLLSLLGAQAVTCLKFLWFDIRPDDSTIMVSLACGSLSGIASSTG